MQIFIYTAEIQTAIKSSVISQSGLNMLTNAGGDYAIYGPDRKIIETGKIPFNVRFRGSYDTKDSKLPLIGVSAVNFQANTGNLTLSVKWELNKNRDGKICNIIARFDEPIECSLIDKYGQFVIGKLTYLSTDYDYRSSSKGWRISGHLMTGEHTGYGYSPTSYRTLDGRKIKFNMPDKNLIAEWLK